VFRGKFVAGLRRAFEGNALRFSGSTGALAEPRPRRCFLNSLYAQSWVVYAKQPFAGPAQVLDYLGRYTHRVAISNNRLVEVTDSVVRFRYKDYAHGNRRQVMALAPHEFIRRFLLHVLPTGFMRIRHYGLLANRAKGVKLAAARAALDQPPPSAPARTESVEDFWLRVADFDIHQCPYCKTGRMRVIGPIRRPQARAPPPS